MFYFFLSLVVSPVEKWFGVVMNVILSLISPLLAVVLHESVLPLLMSVCFEEQSVSRHMLFSESLVFHSDVSPLYLTLAGKEDELPKKPLGQLPPEPAAVVSHMANGQSHAQPAEPARPSSPTQDRQKDSRPPSRSRRDSLEKQARQHKSDKREARSRGSGEIPSDPRKPPSASNLATPERGATP